MNSQNSHNLSELSALSGLPNNWKIVKLGDVAKFIRGVSFPKDAKSLAYSEGRIACLRTANVQKEVKWDDLWFIDEKIVKRDEQFVKIGDILISSANSLELLGKVSLIKQIPFKSTLGTFIVNIRVEENHNNLFVYYYLTSREFTDNVKKNASTTTNISNISVGKLEQIHFPIPPLPEQKKIVAKIEELFSGLDSGVASLKYAKEQIRLYRQSVLASAFSGRLINNEQLIMNNEKLIINNSLLPPGWKIVKLGDIGEVVAGGTPSTKVPEYFDGKIAWITPADLTGYTQKYISKGRRDISVAGLKNSSARIVPKGSILFSSRAPIGYVAIASNELCTNQGFKNLTPNKKANSEFVYYYLKSIKQLAEKNASGTTFKEISAKNFANLPIPLPPVFEQKQIVSEIEKRFSEADNLEKVIDDSLAKSELLRQSILNRAFSGKLV